MAADERDYNLTEEQKAIKAKYPPLNKKYECECPCARAIASGREGKENSSICFLGTRGVSYYASILCV